MKKILIIEDDKIVCENTCEILELANYIVKTANNGKKGVLLANEFKPDLILCDILMPELDGFGVLQIISKTPELESVPFIFLTAKTHYEDLRRGMDLGADDYLTKPIEESELLRAIDSRLKRVEVFEQKISSKTSLIPKNRLSLETASDFKIFLKDKELFTFKKGDTIFYNGNISEYIFVIKKGLVKTYKSNDFGKELITGLYTDNQIFGFVSFTLHIPYQENAKTLSATTLYKINKKEIYNLLKNKSQVIYSFIDVLAQNLLKANEKQLSLAYASVRKKTADTLLQLLEKYPKEFTHEILFKRADLASLIGIAKETLIRTLHDFKQEKLININQTGIEVIDEQRLLKIQ
ncbi:response regulator [Lutibacter sp.]|uniref:response regulator n=1 Tax=Lutibacter sp. TaxID=1925666 RepID=UPI0027355C99|nr:response regulator [Lutibacter sp.]MDP3313256.1 response regulator [Lutibacter sp.]